jgi:hypothetical protein
MKFKKRKEIKGRPEGRIRNGKKGINVIKVCFV